MPADPRAGVAHLNAGSANRVVVTAVLAAHRELRGHHGDDERLDLLRTAFAEPLAPSVADVRRCFFHDVLVANGADLLTPVLCAWDDSWMDAVSPERHHVIADRQTSIGRGGGHCPFRLRCVATDPAQVIDGGTTQRRP